MKKIKITVAGVPYMIATDNDEEYALSLADEINAEIEESRKAAQ